MVNFRTFERFLYWIRHLDKGQRLTRKRDILLAFAFVSLPLLVIAVLLIAYTFNATDREKPADTSIGTAKLPVKPYDTKSNYYTGILPGRFLLLGSWASNVAEIVVAPFMVIFSYTVAWEILHAPSEKGSGEHARPPFLREILQGGYGTSLLRFS